MDKETFARLVIDSTNSLYRVSKSILQNDSDCEDAVSEAITIAFQKLDSLKKDEYAKTWLTRILIHECYHMRKQQSRITLFPHDGEGILNHKGHQENNGFMDVENYSDLYEAMGQLKEKQRLVLTLYYYEGYSIKEIGAIMGITQGTVKSRLGRARNQLKIFLEEESYV
ncbi:MAG: RNA polymerase sigma factor [Lachnospiraceae bacterium]|nr:RNA polymerase sigma factor [Lachnospiraceae bacterium]